MSIRIEEEIRQNELLTVREVATYLRVSRVTVWRWCRQDIIPASRVGRNWRIRRDDLLTLLETSHSISDPAILPNTSSSNNLVGDSTLTTSPALEPDEVNVPA